MNEEIKWSKKEVVERPTQDRWGNDLPDYPIKVNVYRWKNYRLEKELYGENRLFYHIAKDDLYLCDDHGSYNVCSCSNIKEATQSLQHILENGLRNRREWVNPRKEYVWGVLSYKPKRDVKTAV